MENHMCHKKWPKKSCINWIFTCWLASAKKNVWHLSADVNFDIPFQPAWTLLLAMAAIWTFLLFGVDYFCLLWRRGPCVRFQVFDRCGNHENSPYKYDVEKTYTYTSHNTHTHTHNTTIISNSGILVFVGPPGRPRPDTRIQDFGIFADIKIIALPLCEY